MKRSGSPSFFRSEPPSSGGPSPPHQSPRQERSTHFSSPPAFLSSILSSASLPLPSHYSGLAARVDIRSLKNARYGAAYITKFVFDPLRLGHRRLSRRWCHRVIDPNLKGESGNE